MAMNVPFATEKVVIAPFAQTNDGCNDIVTSRTQNGAGNISLMRLLLTIEDGKYFVDNGAIKDNLCIDYHKASKWSLDPVVKGLRPNQPRVEG